jgi:hypothetical protein
MTQNEKTNLWNLAQQKAKSNPKLSQKAHFALAKEIFAELLAAASQPVVAVDTARLKTLAENFWDAHRSEGRKSTQKGRTEAQIEKLHYAELIVKEFDNASIENVFGKYANFVITYAGKSLQTNRFGKHLWVA